MRKSYVITIVAVATLFLIAFGVPGAMSWWRGRSLAQTETLVAKVLDNPSYKLRGNEEDEFYDYLDMGAIPHNKQVSLIKAAFRRVTEEDARSETMLRIIADRWHRDGSFITLPFAVNEAIFASIYKGKEENKDICVGRIVINVGAIWRLDSYLDIEFIMLSVDDDNIILSTCGVCHADTLFAHRSACLTMLKRKDIGYSPKIILLAKIAGFQQGEKWFKGEGALLEWLESLKDARIKVQVRRIREQMGIEGNIGHFGATLPS
jgi:hypothetical protein